MTSSKRSAPRPTERLDRSRAFSFTFDGKSYDAHPGDTIASALAANGVTVLSRSFKYHRPRGLLCCSGHCPNCLVQVGEEMNVRACMTPVEAGMAVEHQNAWPSLDLDIMAATALGDPFLPVGFYYKTFIRPQALWPLYEHVLRHAAGLGVVDPETTHGRFDKQYLHADVVVVGGGPAGISAAHAAASQGARVLLFEENPELGGHTRFAPTEAADRIAELAAELEALPTAAVYTDTTVLGWWEEHWLSAVGGSRLYKIRAGSLVVAAGAYEQPLVFDDNDLPGIMLGSGAQRLLNLYGVLPGKRAVVVTGSGSGWRVAADLKSAGADVAVVDEREARTPPEDLPVHWAHTVRRAHGRGHVRAVDIVPVGGGNPHRLACDLLVISMGWAPANGLLYQAGAGVRYNDQAHEFLTHELPDGVFAAGRVAGFEGIPDELESGRRAGLGAAAFTGPGDLQAGPGAAQGTAGGQDVMPPADGPHGSGRAAGAPRTSGRAIVPGDGKQFVCYCEDVTTKDLKTALAEGYDSIELLKRYSTISMGPCQGKMCSVNTIHITARENGHTIEETGTTTARPPMTPVKLGSLGGQLMEPVRFTPMHTWHEAQGARMMVAGLWMRPEHYGDPHAEVRAVRERVGLIDVSTLGKIRMTGPGTPALLNKMYVNKWMKLGVGRVRYGVMCNDEGVVTDDGVTGRLDEQEWYTTTTSSGASSVYEYIQWWAQSGWGDGVHITNVTENYAAFNLAGPHARDLLAKLTLEDVSNKTFPYMHVRSLNVAGIPCRVFRIGFTGELSFEIHTPSGYGLALWEAIMAVGEDFGISPFGIEAQRILRLEKAHIIVGQDTDALSDPISADMAWIVKHDKANFLGNRPLARIAREGPVQKLVGFKMVSADVVPEEGLQIVKTGEDGGLEIIGWVTSSRFSPTLGEAIGLCWLPAELAEAEGASFRIHRNGEQIEARVHHGAFYDPDGERLKT